MAKTFYIDFKADLEKMAIDAVKPTTDELYFELIKNSPVKTGRFLNQNRLIGVRVEGNKVIGEVVNEGEYSEKVEDGWRKKAVHWHLKDGSIYVSKGADVFKRSLQKVKTNFLKRLG